MIPQPEEPKKRSTNHLKVVLSFEFFNASAECPSVWTGDEMKGLFSTFSKACQRTWQQVIETSGKAHGGKVGLGWTEFNDAPFPRPVTLSQDLRISEMRVSDVARIFGTRKDECFYVIRLDRSHSVCKV